ncbi:MAG: peptidoglycan DD-metalloendopeptidase family protein [Ruminococcus sp.]|nr:peptidoglycan DD-metalloendopeptidase family protein [Ruminococcus sp.]
MGTKFISVEGFSEIKAIDKKNNGNQKVNMTTSQKALRFIKRIPAEIKKDAKIIRKKIGDITWSTLTPAKFFRGIRKFHIKSSYFEFMRSPKGIATALAPVAAALMLVLTVCFWTCSDKPLKVNVDGKCIATIENDKVLTQASAQMHSALSGTDTNEFATTPVIQVSFPTLASVDKSTAADVYEKLVDCNEAVVSNAGGLYVDGVFYGAAEDAQALSSALTDILTQAKAKYDNTTTTTFNNDVQVVTDVYAKDSVKSVEEIIESARQSFSIRLETDLAIDYDKYYTTVYEYDDSQLDTYEEVLAEGEMGSQKVFYRLVYVDGVQTDAVVKSTVVTKEPVDRVVLVGTKQSYTGTGDFTWPVPYTGNITSTFQHRWGKFHYGIDISWNGIYGQDIVASDSGTVTYAGWDNSGYGYCVIIDHGNGFETMYAHCCDVYVSTGEKVLKGDVIAGVGSTGYSTGDHLHFEIIDNGVKVDPEIYVKGTSYIDG